jgi:hypothetical protein
MQKNHDVKVLINVDVQIFEKILSWWDYEFGLYLLLSNFEVFKCKYGDILRKIMSKKSKFT